MEEDKKEQLRQYNRDYYKNNKERRRIINERYWKKRLVNQNEKQEHAVPDQE